MSNNTFEIFEDKMINSETNENVIGIRVMIKGDFKEILDKKYSQKISYSEKVGNLITKGISEIIQEMKK